MVVIDVKETVKHILTDYLEKKNLRRTPERYAILDEIYSIQGYFDVELLTERMNKKKIHICRATFYNTIDLLVACELILKNPNKGLSKYEKAYECVQRDHLICTNCGKVTEFCDPRIAEIQATIRRLRNFDINYYSFHIYGVCEDCNMKPT